MLQTTREDGVGMCRAHDDGYGYYEKQAHQQIASNGVYKILYLCHVL